DEPVCRRQRCCSVAALMRAVQGQPFGQALEVLGSDTSGRSTDALRHALEQLPYRRGRAGADDRRNPCAEDASFLGGNFLEGLSEELRMVDADAGHDAEVRGNRGGAIETSAETHFVNLHVDPGIAEDLR